MILVVLICSVIQSIFGIGLLVFGTPILLLLGIPFSTALLYLLPCSMVISFLQVFEGLHQGEKIPAEARFFLKVSVPLALASLLFVLISENSFSIKVTVGLLLIFNAFSRLVKPLQFALSKMISKHNKSYLAVMGLVHGLTNMGGGLLTIFANTLYKKKETIRFTIAGGYLFFAIAQLSSILFFRWREFHIIFLLLPLLAAAVYLAFGNRLFRTSTDVAYQYLMTLFLFIFGVSLVVF